MVLAVLEVGGVDFAVLAYRDLRLCRSGINSSSMPEREVRRSNKKRKAGLRKFVNLF